MGKTTDITPVMAQGESLQEISARFTRWRETRDTGQHIPRHLWAAAVELARKHGVQAVAGVLRVDGTTRGLPRRFRTAKASHISRRAVKL